MMNDKNSQAENQENKKETPQRDQPQEGWVGVIQLQLIVY